LYNEIDNTQELVLIAIEDIVSQMDMDIMNILIQTEKLLNLIIYYSVSLNLPTINNQLLKMDNTVFDITTHTPEGKLQEHQIKFMYSPYDKSKITIL